MCLQALDFSIHGKPIRNRGARFDRIRSLLISISRFRFPLQRSPGGRVSESVFLLRAVLAQVVRASRMLQRWENYISISYAKQSLIKFFIALLFASHLMACVWGLFGKSLRSALLLSARHRTLRKKVERNSRSEFQD